MKTSELTKMELTPLTDLEMKKIDGGGFWDFYEKAGYVIGVVIGTTLRLTTDLAKKLLERTVLK